MSKKGLIWTVIGWFVLRLMTYYVIMDFFAIFIWLGLSLVLLMMLIILIINLIEERKSITKLRISKIVIFSILFFITLNWLTVNDLIERIDWKISYNKRMEVVEQVKDKQLTPNVNTICELPFEFPVLSNEGNDISIYRNPVDSTVTVKFFISRGFINTAPTCFVYTNDKKLKEELETLIKRDPKNNWKIEENWYRTFGWF